MDYDFNEDFDMDFELVYGEGFDEDLDDNIEEDENKEEDFEDDFEGESSLLEGFKEIFDSLPKNRILVLHPKNFPRATIAVKAIVNALERDNADITYKIRFDSLFGTDLMLQVTSPYLDIHNMGELGNVLALIDSISISPSNDEGVTMLFGFNDVRILAGVWSDEEEDEN